MKNILVTGAAGFIGSYVCERLVNRGFNVVGLDDMSLGLAKNIRNDVHFIQADASKLDDLQDSLSGLEIQGIIHLAGQSGGELSFSETLYDCKSNVLSTLSLLEFAKSRGIRKLVHASSVAVYGAGGNDGEFLDEEQKLNPTSPYGVSKSAAEPYLRVLSEKNRVSATSLRFSMCTDLDKTYPGSIKGCSASTSPKHFQAQKFQSRVRRRDTGTSYM